ncbi:hypothetical protein BH11GEM2_BH11GEM2_32690 [soil metagenome]
MFHVLLTLALILTIAVGQLGWPAYLAFIGIIAFGAAIPTTLAVSLHDSGFRDYENERRDPHAGRRPVRLVARRRTWAPRTNHDHRVIVSPPR